MLLEVTASFSTFWDEICRFCVTFSAITTYRVFDVIVVGAAMAADKACHLEGAGFLRLHRLLEIIIAFILF